MTISYGDPDGDMHALLLQFQGAFSHVQNWIDNGAEMLIRKRMPKAGGVIAKRTVGRIRDDERVELLAAIAEELAADAHLDNFKAVYMRVKKLRDSVAHSSYFAPDGPDRLEVNKNVVNWTNGPNVPKTVNRAQVLKAMQECSWLEAQVTYILSSTEHHLLEIRRGSTLMTVFKPTAQPEDWDGAVYGYPVGDG